MTVSTLSASAPQPELRIMRGSPTPEELAAAVLYALPVAGAEEVAAVVPPGRRRPAHHVPAGAWRTIPR